MATEEEAREAADGEAVQVEAADLGTTHLQMNLGGKLSSHGEIKDEAKIMDSTEGLLKVTEDQVSEKAHSAVEIPQEHTPNGTASSLNGHLKEGEISNEKPQQNGQKDSEHVEASSDGINSDQSSKSNGEEAIDSLGHVESTTEDTSLLKHENEEPKEHYNQDVHGAAAEDKMVQEDTLQTDEPTVDDQQEKNLEPAKVTEEVVAEAPSGVQTSLEPNVDDSGALPDATDGNRETEPAKLDKESCPEDEDISEHPNEIVKLEVQPSKQTDDVDADMVQEEVPKSKKTEVPEDITQTEQADESTNGDQEELNQESPEDTSDLVHEKTEEISLESNVSTFEETTLEHDATSREPALDVQEVQSQGLAEEIADSKEVDAEKTVQQSGVAFEDATPEDNVATIEPSSDIRHLNNVESEEIKGLEDATSEETSNESNVTSAEDAAQDKEATDDIQPVQGLEEEPKSTATVEKDEASNQPHADVLNNLAEEDGLPACQPQVIELEEEVKDTGVTETQEITQQSHVASSEELATEDNSMETESGNDDIQQTLEQGSVEVKNTEASETQEICHERTISSEEDSVEDDVTAERTTSDAQEVENVETVEEIKDNTADNIIEASSVATVEEADQENNVLTSEDVSEKQTRGLEPEGIQNSEPVETEEASDQRHPALLNDPAPEDIIPSDMLKTESTAEVKEIEATKTEAIPQESNVSTSEEPASEENITASEITCDAQEVPNLERAEYVGGNKYTGIQEISDQSNDVFAREAAQGTSELASEPTVDMQSVQELQSETEKNAELIEASEVSDQMDASILENPKHEDSPTTSETLVMESAEVSSSEATEGQEMPQSEVTQSEDHETEENTTASEPKILEPEPAEEMQNSEATVPRSISHQSIVASSEESVPEEDVTAKEPASDIKEVQTEEPELIEEHNDVKDEEIPNQSSGTIVGDTAQENLESATVAEETEDVKSTYAIGEEETPEEHVQVFETPFDIPPVEEPELKETKNTKPVEVHDNVMTNDLPAEEVKDTEAREIAEIHNESGDLTEDDKSNVALEDETAPDEDAKATEATADIPQAQEPELEEIKNTEPVEVEDNIIACDRPEEEIKDSESIETAVTPEESTSANISELTNDVKSSVALADETTPEEHVIATEATIDIPRAQEPELEEIKNTEPAEVEENISATEQSAEEIEATETMETEAINESIDANNSELTEDVKSNVTLTDEAAPDNHAKVAEATGDVPRAQEPELEDIKNSEPVEVEDDIIASEMPEEEIKDTEASETEVIPDESTSANISELTKDVKINVAFADEAAPEEHIMATEATTDIPRAQEPELEEIKNTEPVEVEENISSTDQSAEEICPEDEDISEHPNEIVKLEVQPSKQTDDVDADMVQEEVPKSKKTDVPEDITQTEQADESTNGDQEELNQESPEDTRDLVHEKTEETSLETNVSAFEETTLEHDATSREPALDVQEVQSQGLAEEIADSKEVDAEKTVQQSGVAFEDATPEDNVATIEPSSDIRHLNNVESEEMKGLEDATSEETSNESNVTSAEDAAQDKEATDDIQPVQGLEEEPKSTATVEKDEASNQPHADVLNNLAEEDGLPACQPQVIELEEEVKDTGVTETQEITQQSHVAASEELATEDNSMETESGNDDIQKTLEQGSVEVKNTEASETQEICHERTISSEQDSVEDDVTAERTTSDAQEVENVETVEEIKDNTAGNIIEASSVATVEEADQENNVLTSEDVSEQQTRGLEPEGIQNSEPVETEEASDRRHPALLNDPAPEDIIPSDMLKTESTAEVKKIEATKTEAIPQESNVSTSEEPASEENITASEITCDAQEVQNLERAEDVGGNKYTGIQEISDQSNDVFAREAAQGTSELASEPTVDMQSVQELQSETEKNAELIEASEVSDQMDASILENPTHEDSPTTSETLVMESAEVSSSEATEGQEMPQSEVTQSEDHRTEENTTASEPKILEPEPAEEMQNSEATEPRSISHQSIVASSEESVPEEDVTAKEPVSDIKEVQTEEPELIEEHNDVKAEEIPNQSSGTIVGDTAQENLESATVAEETEDVKSTDAIGEEETPEEHVQVFETPFDIPPVEEPELKETKNTEPVEVHDNVMTNDLPAEEVKDTEAREIAEIHNESGDLTEDVKSNVALADETAPDEDAKATEATADIPQAQEPELEEIKNTEPVEVEDNIIACDRPEEEIKDSESIETAVTPEESTSANISELTNDVKSSVALADETTPEEHVIATEATIDIPRAQEPELEEIKNTEPAEVEENISATAQSAAEEIEATETMETEAINKSIDANNSELTEDVKSNVTLTDEAAPDNHAKAAEATGDVPRAQEPELEDIKNSEPVEVEDDIIASEMPEEEIKDTEASETEVIPDESTSANISELTKDVKINVAFAYEAAPEEHIMATEATTDIPRAQEPELEEIKNTEPVEVEENISSTDQSAEEIEATESMETEAMNESIDANNGEVAEDVKSNVALTDEAVPEEHAKATEATADIPQAQEPKLEEIKNSEPVEVEDDIIATDLPGEEIKDTEAIETEVISDESTSASISELTNDVKENMETEAINESTDANNSELTENVNRNFSLEDEAAYEEHVIAAETTAHTPRAQEPELEEIKNTDPVEVKESISASDLPAQEVKETEATETVVISKNTDANISEPTEDAKRNVTLADEVAPEEHALATEETVDIPQAQEPELEEIENAEHAEVEEYISTNDLPAEEVKDTETMETEAINDSTDANISELTKDVSLADGAVPKGHVDIPPAQEPAIDEINNTEPVEAEDSITADDVPAEEINETEAMETEDIPHESTGDSLTASAPVAGIQQAREQEAVEDKKCTDTTENQGGPQLKIVSTAAELTPTEEETTVTEPTQDTHVQNATTQETESSEHVKNQEFSDHSILSTAEVAAQESPLPVGELPSDVQQVLERDSTEETRGTEAVQIEDGQQHGVSNLEKPVSENNESESELNVANQVQEDKSAEVEDTEVMETEKISIQDNIPTTENAAQESSEPGSDPDLLVQSEDDKDQLVKSEETGQSNGATLEEPIAEDNAANETDLLADTKEEHGLESVEGNKGNDDTEGEEASHPSKDAGLEELVSESIVATIEPTSDIQQVNDLDEAKEMTATEAIDDEETSCKKTEVATLEDLSPIDNGTSPKQKDESSDLGEKTALTQKGESPTEEDVVPISLEDTVGNSNNIEQIKEQSKSVIEDDAIKSGEHTSDQDDKQLHNVELQMQVCERSLYVSAIEQTDADIQKVNLDQQPDEDIQKVNLDQQQKEDEAIEKQTEEIQRDEQEHDGSSADLATLLEPQSSEIGTKDLNEDTDVFEDEKTETVATEMVMTEQTLHIPQGHIPSIADVKVENSTEIEETPEKENAPNNSVTLYTDADAESFNKDEKENIEIDAAVAKLSTDEQDGPTDETINEENPTVVPQNVEPRVDTEENESINKANDDTQVIQASEEIFDEVEKKQEMQNEDTDVNNDDIQTTPVDKEASVLHSNDTTDIKVDDTMSPYAEMIHGRIDAQPTEIEEVQENMGFSSISEQNDVEQDLSIHPKALDDKLAIAEQNGAKVETNSIEEMATSYTAVTEAVKIDEAIYDKASGADGALSDENLETSEDNRWNLEASSVVTAPGESMNEDKEHHDLALPAHSAVDGNTTEQASGLEVTERGMLFPEKPLPTESEEHEESLTTKEQDEEDIHEQETGDTEKEEKDAEQSDLPVSNFLMNLIMGKQSTEADGNSEFEDEKKQEETTHGSCLITSQQEESLVPIPTENKVDNKLIFEQGKHNLEGSEETHAFKLESDEDLGKSTHDLEAPVCQNNVKGEICEPVSDGPGLMTEVETRDVKLYEKATNSEEGSLKSNLDDSTNPKASEEDTLEEGRTDLLHESLREDISSDAVAGQTLLLTEPDTGDEKKLPNDTDDLQSPLSTVREESTESSIIEAKSTIEAELENEAEKEENKQHTTNTGGATEGEIENSHDNSQKGKEAISDDQMAKITEPVMDTEINLVHEKEISAGSECEDEKESYKLSNSELDNSEKELEIQSDGSSLHINQDKQDEFVEEKIVMEKNSLLDKPGESNLQEEQETEIGQKSPKESDGGDQNSLAIREPVIKEENVNRTVESHVQAVNTKSNEEQETFTSQVQERNLDVVSAKEAPEAEENFVEMAKPELSTDEEQIPKEDKSNMAGERTYDEKTKDEEEAKRFTDEATRKIEEQGAVQKASHNQARDLNVVLPTEAPGSEESFVDVKTPEFSTDEEQSPKKDESNMAEEKSNDEKINGDEEAKNFTDEAPMKIEEREAGQKASPKKHNILSGVGSKVKHQLAKVKKAIIGKPGHTKSELPKS